MRAAAGGRTISDAKLKAIDDAIGNTMQELARRDRTRWVGLTRDQRMTEAVSKAMADLQAAAALKEYKAGLQMLRMAETNARIADQQQRGGDVSRSQALARDAQNTENSIHGIRNEAMSALGDLFKAAESRDGTGLLRNLGMRVFGLDNPQMTADVVREVYRNADGFTGNKPAIAGAKAWLEVIEQMRQKANTAGFDIGKLGYGYLSQAHNTVRIRTAGAEAWVGRLMKDAGLLDRNQYVREDGSLMNDAEMGDLLRSAHETISTDGANKHEPGQFTGTGARANRGADHRVLHFKDGDAWIEYMKDYGNGTLYSSMLGHIDKMARDIGLVEAYGPNAAQTYRVQADIADRADTGFAASRAQGSKPMTYWELISGNASAAENRVIAGRTLAQWGQDARNVQTAAKIGWGPFMAIGDLATIPAALHFNRLPYFEMIANVGTLTGQRLKQVAGFGKGEFHEFLQSHGVIAESLSNDMQRMVGDNFTHNLTGQVTAAVMRLQLINAWTDGFRAAFSGTMMRNFAKKIGTGWDELDAWDQQLLGRKGITEDVWAVISRAVPAERKGKMYLTASGIKATGDPMAQQAATKWLAFIDDEAQFAVIGPDLATRSVITGGATPAGTVTGEAWRSFGQFKSFPVAMVTRTMQRIVDTPQGLEGAPLGFGGGNPLLGGEVGAKIGMLAAMAVTMTLLGAIQTQSRQVLSGKDPIDMTGDNAVKFGVSAFGAGGGGGFFTNVLLAPLDDPQAGFGSKLGMFGPVAGSLGGLIDVAKADKNQGARAVGWISDQLPGVDIWQLRAAWEHWALYTAQEAISPGYLNRVEQRARKNWGQEYFWAPGEALPDRAPDLAGAFGQ